MVDSSFCAGTVPSQTSGGDRQVSQLPAGQRPLGEVGEQLRAAAVGRLAQREHRVQVRRHPPPVREVALGGVDQPPLLHHVGQAVGRARRSRAARHGPPARSPGSSPRRSAACPGARRTARPACRSPCRTRSSRPSPGRPRAGTAPGARRACAASRPAWYGSAGMPLLGEERGDLLRRVAGQAVHDPGVSRVLGAQQRKQLLASARSSARSGTGCSAGRTTTRTASTRPA